MLKIKQVKISSLKKFDRVVDFNGSVGIVTNIGNTLLHKHKYIKIKFIYERLYDVIVYIEKYIADDLNTTIYKLY